MTDETLTTTDDLTPVEDAKPKRTKPSKAKRAEHQKDQKILTAAVEVIGAYRSQNSNSQRAWNALRRANPSLTNAIQTLEKILD